MPTENPTIPSLSAPRTLHETSESRRGADGDSGWGSSRNFGQELASNRGWGSAPHCEKAASASKQNSFSKSNDSLTHASESRHDADGAFGWGSSSNFGWGLASNLGRSSASGCDKVINVSGQKNCSKSSDPLTCTAPRSQVGTGELVVEGATAFWKPPPLQDCPKSRVTSKKAKAKEKQAKRVWSNFFEMDSAPGLPVEPGQTAMVRLNNSLLSEEDAKFASETEMEAPQMPTRCMFWDRAHGRCLTFFRPWKHDDRIHYDQSVFGFPLHDIRYWTKEGRKGYLPVGKPSTWAYFDPQPKSQNPVGTEPSLEDCRPKPAYSFALPPSVSTAGSSVNLVSAEGEIPLTSVSPEAPIFDYPRVQHPCEPAPSMSGGYGEKLDCNADDEESHNAAPATTDPVSSPVSHSVADANTAPRAEVLPAAAQFPDIQPKNVVTNTVETGIITQKEQGSVEVTTPVLDSGTRGVHGDLEMGSESATATSEYCFTL